MTPIFEKGDQVKIKESLAKNFPRVWEARIRRGLVGTVDGFNDEASGRYPGYIVNFPMPKNAKYPQDWRWIGVKESDLEPA